MPPTGHLALNPSMHPDWESNWQLFGSQVGVQSIEPHQPVAPDLLKGFFWFTCLTGVGKTIGRETLMKTHLRKELEKGRGGQRNRKAENRSLESSFPVGLIESFIPTCLVLTDTFLSPVTHSPAVVPVTPVLHHVLQTVVQVSVAPVQLQLGFTQLLNS